MGIEGVYPRWLGFANLSREFDDDREDKHINSIFHLGNSKREIELKVAPGFPNVDLNENQIIISKSYANFFETNLKDDQIGKELFDPNLSLNLTFDLLGMFMDTQ